MLRSAIAVSKMSNTPVIDSGPIRPLNARSLALSILLGTHPPELPVRALIEFGRLFGISDGTMRTALSRLVAAGDVVGEDGRYRLAGRLVALQGAQDVGRRSPSSAWDGSWHVVVAADDQRDLADRRSFRATMSNHRLAELRPDIWLRPANLGPPPASDDVIITTGPIRGTDPVALARRLWDLPDLARQATTMLRSMETHRAATDWDDPASIPPLFTLSAGIVRFLRLEPLLPGALTPDDWPIDELRTVYDGFEADHQRLLRAFLRSTR